MKILYVGRFATPKNNLAIIKICKILKQDGVSFSLDFYGDAENVDAEGINIKNIFFNDLDGLHENIRYNGYADKIDIFSINHNRAMDIALTIMEKLVCSGIHNDSRNLGANYVLCALTLVSADAALSLPWLFQSVL